MLILFIETEKQIGVLQRVQTLPSCGMHRVFVLKLMLFIVAGMILAGEQKKQRLFPRNSSRHTTAFVQGLKVRQKRSIYIIPLEE